MANRRIEMHEYQEALYRMRQGHFESGVQGMAIHAALARDHGFKGHYSSVRPYHQRAARAA